MVERVVYRPFQSFIGHPRRLLSYLVSVYGAPAPQRYGHPLEAYDETFMPILAGRLRRLAVDHGWSLPATAATDIGANDSLGPEEASLVARFAAAYLSSGHVDDLYDIPGVTVDRVGHRLTPDAPRRELLLELSQLPPRTWLRLDKFIHHLATVTPLIYRPMRDHHNWCMRGEAPGVGVVDDGGFAAVEGAWAAHVIAGPLTAFGIVALGLDESGRLDAFRLTHFGRGLLNGEAALTWTVEQENWVLVQPNFELLMPLQADRWVEQIVLTVALPKGGDAYRIFHIEPKAVLAALDAGRDGETLIPDLAACCREPLPQNVRWELSTWIERYGAVTASLQVVIEVEDPHVLDELEHTPGLRNQVRRLGERSAALSPSALAALAGWAMERSLLPRIEGEALRLAVAPDDTHAPDRARALRRSLAEAVDSLGDPRRLGEAASALLANLSGQR